MANWFACAHLGFLTVVVVVVVVVAVIVTFCCFVNFVSLALERPYGKWSIKVCKYVCVTCASSLSINGHVNKVPD